MLRHKENITVLSNTLDFNKNMYAFFITIYVLYGYYA